MYRNIKSSNLYFHTNKFVFTCSIILENGLKAHVKMHLKQFFLPQTSFLSLSVSLSQSISLCLSLSLPLLHIPEINPFPTCRYFTFTSLMCEYFKVEEVIYTRRVYFSHVRVYSHLHYCFIWLILYCFLKSFYLFHILFLVTF